MVKKSAWIAIGGTAAALVVAPIAAVTASADRQSDDISGSGVRISQAAAAVPAALPSDGPDAGTPTVTAASPITPNDITANTPATANTAPTAATPPSPLTPNSPNSPKSPNTP